MVIDVISVIFDGTDVATPLLAIPVPTVTILSPIMIHSNHNLTFVSLHCRFRLTTQERCTSASRNYRVTVQAI